MSTAKTRLRIRFTKQGDLRWIGHRDLARVWERLLRRANLELAFSQGFHPKPKISFPSALALGIEALDEIVELEVMGEFDISVIENDIRQELPDGMELLEISSPPADSGKAKVAGATYSIALGEVTEDLTSTISQLMGQQSFEIERDGKTITCPTDHPYFDIRLEGSQLFFTLPTLEKGSIRPSELLAAIGLGNLLEDGETLCRTEVHLRPPKSSQVKQTETT